MLARLHIQNFALIERLDLNFQDGFTVFTGETGSGKSIILGALSLILGERAETSSIRDKEQKAVVEAVFDLKNLSLQTFFTENDLDFSDETIIRREIQSNGRSRAFINDTPVQLSVLSEFSTRLIQIHSQFHTYSLKSKQYQQELLDTLAEISLANYQQDFKTWQALKKEVADLEQQLEKANRDADYVQFQINELEALNLSETNYAELQQHLTQLENSQEIIQLFSSIYEALENESGGVLSTLSTLKAQLTRKLDLHPTLKDFDERLQSVILELKDMGETAEQAGESIETNLEKQQEIAEKLDTFNRELTKHQVTSQEDLAQTLNNYLSQNQSISEIESQLEKANKTLQALTEKLQSSSKKIHQQRLAKKTSIEKSMETLLHELKLQDAKVKFEVTETENFNEFGCSKINLFFNSNKGSQLQPIEKAASGGELSRLMLVIENVLSERKKLPTLVLDEIDTGVSGEVALKIGQMLGKMGKKMQLFSITHLPQVAAKGQHHFKVYKTEENGSTKTFVRALTNDERLTEIAGLMSGEKISDAAIENAKILMQ